MNMFRAFMELDKINEAATFKTPFANNIDSDIIAGLNSEVPEEPVLGNMVKCSKSAPLNALYYVSKGENVKFNLGTIKLPLKQITHCWIEHNGKVAQTRNDRPDSDLITKFSVDLIPNDIDASKKLIIDLISSINGDNLDEGIFDRPTMSNWVTASGKPVNLKPNTQPTAPSQPVASQTQQTSSNRKYKVRIVSDHGRLRALGTDGVHPGAWVAFPNDLRQFDGQLYEVDQLIWNGKNYRVAGNIVEI